MKKPWRKCTPKANSRPLFNFGKWPKAATACKEFFHKSDTLKDNLSKALKKLTLYFFRTVCRWYITRRSFECYLPVPVCHLYVTRMHKYVIRMSIVCTRMSSVCHSCVLVCHSSVVLPWTVHLYVSIYPWVSAVAFKRITLLS